MYRVQPYTRPDTGHCPAAPRAPASAVRAPAPGIAPRQCSVSQSVVGSSDVARRSSRRRTFVRVSASHSPIVLPIQPPRVAFVRLWRVSAQHIIGAETPRREQPRRRDNTVEVEPPASLFARVVSCLWRCFGGQVRVRCTICTSGRRAHFSRSTHDGFGVSLPSRVRFARFPFVLRISACSPDVYIVHSCCDAALKALRPTDHTNCTRAVATHTDSRYANVRSRVADKDGVPDGNVLRGDTLQARAALFRSDDVGVLVSAVRGGELVE